MGAPGRSCPASYGYGARLLAGAPAWETGTLWIAGGLYGNPFALEALVAAYQAERGAKALVFNGDFHWFDIDARDFQRVNDTVLGFHATRGNVETELASPHEGAGCGCGYPDFVDEGTVERSNRILERLRSTARGFPVLLKMLATLPMHLIARVGHARIAIVHGDADALAGWGFSQEALGSADGLAQAAAAAEESGADVIASSHTCLPVLQAFAGGQVLINNGAAGMPNFRGEACGLATRIALTPARERVYGLRRGDVFIDAVPLRYDSEAWKKRFLEQWPAGSDAHASYYERIANGPRYAREAALREAALATSR
jgi:predicted phosphodiesterase